MKITFLLDNAYGIGGTIRSTVNLSRALADRHTVEVVSLRQSRDEPALPFDPRITLRSLIDQRRDSPAWDGRDPLFHQPSERFAEGPDHLERRISTRLGDVRMAAYLRETDADVVIATRPKLNDYLAAYGSSRYLRIGQEHLIRQTHREHTRVHQDAAIPYLDAFVTVSYADAADYRTALPEATAAGTVIDCIPNSVPAPDVEPSDGRSRLIVAAGRLIRVKRYDRLLKAFALVSERHPDWRLRLYGRGRLHPSLRETIDRLALYDRAFLMGAHAPIETEWAKGAIAAVSSNAEAFGMTLVEAMHCGVPVVSTDCPHGPGEIITNGREGLLAPMGKEAYSVRALADAMLHLIENPGLRQRMGQAALARSRRYAPERIAVEYEELIEKLHAHKAPAPVHPAQRTTQPAQPPASRRPVTFHRLAAPAARAVQRRLHTLRSGDTRARSSPHARVRVTEDGSVDVRLRLDRLPPGAFALLLQARREDSAAPVRIRLPSRREAVDGWLTVRLDRATLQLPEARLDAYVEHTGRGLRRRKRICAELIETARLLSRPTPLDGDGALAPWVPYTTSDGHLVVRAWRRAGHAEITSIELGQRTFIVRAQLHGTAVRAADTEAAVVAVPRTDRKRGFEVPARRTLESAVVELPYDVLGAFSTGGPGRSGGSGAPEEVWDLWLRPGGPKTPRVRLGRLHGDLADRKRTDVVPMVRLGENGTGLQLFFTLANNLAVELKPMPRKSADSGNAPAREPSSASA